MTYAFSLHESFVCHVLNFFLVVYLSKNIPHHYQNKDISIIFQMFWDFYLLYSSVFPGKPESNISQWGQNLLPWLLLERQEILMLAVSLTVLLCYLLDCVILFHTDPECFLSGSLLMTFMFLLLLWMTHFPHSYWFMISGCLHRILCFHLLFCPPLWPLLIHLSCLFFLNKSVICDVWYHSCAQMCVHACLCLPLHGSGG